MQMNIIGKYRTKSEQGSNRGFTLVASLLMLLLLSGVAIGLLLMANTEGKVGGTDMQNNLAYHAAEGGIEKMASDLSDVFKNAQSPTASQVCAISGPPLGSASNEPSMIGVTWKDYTIIPGAVASSCPGSMTTQWGSIGSGPNAGLYAQVIPISMFATASVPGGQEVSMMRSAQVALIPVFQYGVFSEGDLGFYSSPNLTFSGRVHTNADLYLGVASGAQIVFENKLEAYGNVVTQVLPNGLAATSYNDTGSVYVPTAPNGCLSGGVVNTSTSCYLKNTNGDSTYGQGSVTGGGSTSAQTGSAYNASNWNPFSKTNTNYMVINGNYGATGSNAGTGAKKLSMPFVSGTNSPFEIIRQPPSGEDPTSPLGQAREYNMAQIHVLLADSPAELPGGASDTNNVRLANVGGSTPSNQFGISTSTVATTTTASAYYPNGFPALSAGSTYNMYFAMGSNGIPDVTSCNNTYCPTANAKSSIANDWPYGPATPASGAQTLYVTGAPIVTGTGGSATAAPSILLCPPTNVSSSNRQTGCPTSGSVTYPYYSNVTTTTWNLIDGYLRVEYKDSSGTWHPVTNEWLSLGFARGITPPNATTTNPINPNAILLLQEPADRRAHGSFTTNDYTGLAPVCNATSSGTCTAWSNPLPPEVLMDASIPTPPSTSTNPWFGVTNSSTTVQSASALNWYPINFYDAREGEPRDADAGNNSCTSNGLMNAVEIDVGNLKKWINGNIGTTGTSVDYVAQNGYVLYFSDRRGMLPSPHTISSHPANTKTGDSGLEDVVNSSSSAGTPDGALDPVPTGRTYSPEDVNGNGYLDEYGTANLGLGQFNGSTNLNAQIIAATPDNPYSPRITSCATTGRKNWVSGARHVLKLVDGALNNIPLSPTGGGFTVAAENPVYIEGDYNSNSTDPFWTGGADATGHAPAAVIADAVTVLSNNWGDPSVNNELISMIGHGSANDVTYAPTNCNPCAGGRNAVATYYRVAIAGGKNMNFPFPSWASSANYGLGTDGGVHNFLRFLEDWYNPTPRPQLNYGGSLVSLYYATYNTGIFKCCTYSVYAPPLRNYIFDSDFTTPSGLPPGTPMFRDVEALGYRQLFTARTN